MPRKDLDGQIAIVTGASSGIGRATALALAQEGAHLVLAARRAELLEQVACEIRSLGQEALVVPTDVTQRDQVRDLFLRTLERWARIDVLVANAGQMVRCPVRELTVGVIERSMAVNFYGTVYAVLEAIPHMLAQKSGHLVLVSSVDGRKGIPREGPYVMAKFAMRGLGEVLRQELRGTGVDVSVIYPARVDTAMIDFLEVPWISPKMPPEKVAGAIVRAIRRRQCEVIIGFRNKALDLANVLAPGLADWVVRVFHIEGREIECEQTALQHENP